MGRNQLYAILAVVVAAVILAIIFFSAGGPQIVDGDEPDELAAEPETGEGG